MPHGSSHWLLVEQMHKCMCSLKGEQLAIHNHGRTAFQFFLSNVMCELDPFGPKNVAICSQIVQLKWSSLN
jgi:hypothetical protein